MLPVRCIYANLSMYFTFIAAPPVIPVSDIKGTDSMAYTKQEKALRCKLAACYRLADINGWTHSIYNHITVSRPKSERQTSTIIQMLFIKK